MKHLLNLLEYDILMSVIFLVAMVIVLLWIQAKEKCPDPIEGCDLYKDEGCAHVDGLLCDYPGCVMLKDYRDDQVE